MLRLRAIILIVQIVGSEMNWANEISMFDGPDADERNTFNILNTSYGPCVTEYRQISDVGFFLPRQDLSNV